TTPSLSVSTLILAMLAGFSAASLVLILVVITESLTKVAGLLRSVSESPAKATGASAVPMTKHVAASLNFMRRLLSNERDVHRLFLCTCTPIGIGPMWK